jgi:prepilin-type N-terminal cleavage/methylation domain-containing protein
MKQKGFSLLEVLAAVTILAGVLFSVARIVSASYLYASKIQYIYLGTELARLKMHDIEVYLKEEGIPNDEFEDEGDFDRDEYRDFKWKYSIKRVFIPLPDFNPGGDDVGGYQEQAVGMMGMAKGNIEDFFKERIRKLTLKVYWGKGERESEKVVFTYFLTTLGQAGEFRQNMPKGRSPAPIQPGKNTPPVPPSRFEQKRFDNIKTPFGK